MGLTKYVEAGKINLYNSLIYFWDFISSAFFIGIIIFIFINLWKVVYAGGDGLIEGFTINMMVWYLVMTESIVVSPGRVLEDIGDEIQSGNIAQNLNKPYNYILFTYASTMGRTLLKFFVTLGVASLVAFIFIGGFDINFKTLPIVAIAVFLALTLHFAMMALLGVLAFWIEDAKGTNFVYNKIIFVLGGMLLPLEIFPQWLANIGKVLPFSYVAYHPAKLWVKFDWSLVADVLLKQIMWIAIMAVLIIIVYNICIRKMSINGG